MRQSAGTSVKSSLSHTFLYDTRDDKISATRGAYGKIFQELAGFGTGGDARFYKVEMEGQVSRKLQETGVVRSSLCLVSIRDIDIFVVSVTGSKDGPFMESRSWRKDSVLRPVPAWRANFCKVL